MSLVSNHQSVNLKFFFPNLLRISKKCRYFAPQFLGEEFNYKILRVMSKICQITGKKVITGNSVSHSNRKTKRTFKPNLQIKRFYVPEWDEWVVLKVSAAGLRTIDKKGVFQAIMDASMEGHINRW